MKNEEEKLEAYISGLAYKLDKAGIAIRSNAFLAGYRAALDSLASLKTTNNNPSYYYDYNDAIDDCIKKLTS